MKELLFLSDSFFMHEKVDTLIEANNVGEKRVLLSWRA